MHRIRYYFEDSRWVGESQWWWVDGITYIPKVGEMVYFPFANFQVQEVGHHVRGIPTLEFTRKNQSQYDSDRVYVSVNLGVLILEDAEKLAKLINGGLQEMGWEPCEHKPFH